LRILHVTDRTDPRGGADWHLRGVLHHLGRRHELLVAVGRSDGSTPPPCPFVIVAGLDVPGNARVADALDELAARFRPDVIHIHNAVGPSALAWAAGRGAIATVQDHRSFCPGRGKLTGSGVPCRQPLERARCAGCFTDSAYFEDIDALTRSRLGALGRMRVVTVLSRYMRGELVAAGVAPGAVEVVPPFVHGLAAAAAADRGPPCVLFAGRLVEAKGVADAVAAWRRSQVDLPLVVAGTGPLRGVVESAGGQVLGWIDHDRMATLYRRARALLLPSRWQEPFGIVGLEAQSFGVAVVAYRSGGVSEWHADPELLVPWGDGDALAAALRTAVARPARPRAAGLAPEVAIGRLERLYARLAAAARR
jgi:glycosyltransferase involved in cell wall biosynthesis